MSHNIDMHKLLKLISLVEGYHTCSTNNNEVFIPSSGGVSCTKMNLTREGAGVWESMRSMPEHRSNHQMVSVGNSVYLIGGTHTSSDLLVYNITMNTWSTFPTQLITIVK